MIAIIGDIHQHFDDLRMIVDGLPSGVSHVLQVGDLFVRPDSEVPPRLHWRPLSRPVLYVDGNHHYFPETRHLREPTEVRPSLVYCPRGQIMRLGDRTVGFLGGADTVADRDLRTPGTDWWPDEEGLTARDVDQWRRVAPGSVDLLITHTPPASVTYALKGEPAHPSAVCLQQIWEHLGYPELVCGHMHEPYQHANVEVLPFLGLTFR